jgi:hypothetical protein
MFERWYELAHDTNSEVLISGHAHCELQIIDPRGKLELQTIVYSRVWQTASCELELGSFLCL